MEAVKPNSLTGWLVLALTTNTSRRTPHRSTPHPHHPSILPPPHPADWPLVALSAHWLAGCAFVALAGLLVTELRRVLHPDVLR